MQLVVSIRDREKLRDVTGDPWDGRSLEWATPSPPPFFNFAVMPNVEGEEAYWGIKQRAVETQQLAPEPTYEPIEMPVNSRGRLLHGVFHVGLRVRDDLAHLVARHSRAGSRVRGIRGLRLA